MASGKPGAVHISALSRTQDLIVRGDWLGVDLGELVRIHASVVRSETLTRYTIAGPDLRISPHAAQALGLALHELFAGSSVRLMNALEGNVTVTWTGDQIERGLKFVWSEAVDAEHDDGDEFARDVLKKVSPLSLNGVGSLSITAAGWQWSLSTTSDVVFGPQIVDPLGAAHRENSR